MHFKVLFSILLCISSQVVAQNTATKPILTEYEKCLGIYQYIQSKQAQPAQNIQAVTDLFSSSIYVLSEGVPDNFNAQAQANILHISLMRMNPEQRFERLQKLEDNCLVMLRNELQQVMNLSSALFEKQKSYFTHSLEQGLVSPSTIEERKALLTQQKGLLIEDSADFRKVSFRRAMGGIKEEVTHFFTLPSHPTHPALYFVSQKTERGKPTQTTVSGSHAGSQKEFASFLLALQNLNR